MLKKLVSGMLLAMGVVSVQAHADDAESQALQRALLNMQNQMQSMQLDLASANGQIEELNYELQRVKAENAELKKQIAEQSKLEQQDKSDVKSEADNKASETPKQLDKAPVSNLKAADKKVTDEYNAAYELVKQNKLSESEVAFKNFLDKNAENSLSPNAWYWLGQVQYKQEHFKDARVSFLNAAGYKNSAKRPDALYKLGLIYKALGDNDKAKRFFEVVVKSYPNDTSAILAKKQLQFGYEFTPLQKGGILTDCVKKIFLKIQKLRHSLKQAMP